MFCAVDLVPGNLSQLQILTLDAQPKWFNLGLALGVDHTKLKTIEADFRYSVERCFLEMLSTWLHMSSPELSWERLITALKQPTVGLDGLAKRIEELLGIAVSKEASLTTAATTGMSACTLNVNPRIILTACTIPPRHCILFLQNPGNVLAGVNFL